MLATANKVLALASVRASLSVLRWALGRRWGVPGPLLGHGVGHARALATPGIDA